MKKHGKKLRLNKETLHQLSNENLQEAAGGASQNPSCTKPLSHCTETWTDDSCIGCTLDC